jgi:EF hand
MKRLVYLTTTCTLLVAIPFAMAQRSASTATAKTKKSAADNLVARLMQFDEDKDGKLTKAEVTDERLQRLFDRADANHDGVVTKQELTALAAREPARGQGGFGGPGGPGGGFGPPGGGPGGFGMGPPRPGQILPPMLRDRLELTPEQSKQVDALQKEVDARLDKILNEDQRAQLKQMRERGPGGFGPPPGGPGGFGPPPGGFGGPGREGGPPPPGGPGRGEVPPPDQSR